ncbi:MAG: serine/threonine-protein kinase, partial [Myxococcota bacterium]
MSSASRGPTAPAAGVRATVADQAMHAAIASSMFGPDVAAPAHAGRFRIGERLGSGGMGTVYAAHDPLLDRRVALKVLRGDVDDPDAATRLQREAVALARLSHPNVVAVHEVGSVADEIFIAMEYVGGGDLAAWMSANPVGPPGRRRRALRLLIDAGRGLAAAHDVGLVHRDFKPSNVLVGDDGRVRVADFGLVRSGDEDERAFVCTASGAGIAEPLTQTGSVMGTPRFMSPEQRRGASVDARSDQFSFCVTGWQLLFGEPPWPGAPDASRPPSPPAGAPSWIVAVLARGLETDPRRRYPSMAALLVALRSDPTVRHRRLTYAGIGLAIAGVGASGYGYHRATMCQRGADAVARQWTPNVRERVRLALASGRDDADATWQRIDAQLTAFASEWAETFTGVCEAARRRGELSETQYVTAQNCLTMREAEFDAALTVLGEGGRTAAALEIAYGVGTPRTCAHTDRQGEVLDLPPRPEEAREILALYREILIARTLQLAGDSEAADEALDAIAPRIAVTDHVALRLREVDVRTRSAGLVEDRAANSATIEAAYWDALAAGEDAMAARFARRTAIARTLTSDDDDALAWIR